MVRKLRDLETRLAERSDKLTKLIDAAGHLFYERGYDATSVRDIAEAVGILKGSVYSHVDSKEDLLYCIVIGVHGRFATALDEIRWDETKTPLERLTELFSRHQRELMADIEKSRVYDRSWRRLGEPRKSIMVKRRSEYRDTLVELITSAQVAGEIAPTKDPQLLAAFAISSLNSLNEWYDPVHFSADAIVRECISTLIDGMRK